MTDSLDGLIEVYNTETGLKQRVPADWLDSPVVGRNLRRTPLQVAADVAAGDRPTDDWTKTALEDFATSKGIEVPDGALKADVWDAVSAFLAEGDAALKAASTPPAAVVLGASAAMAETAGGSSYGALLDAQTALVAQMTEQITNLQQQLADAAASGAAAGRRSDTTDLDTTDGDPAPDTTDTPAAGDEE